MSFASFVDDLAEGLNKGIRAAVDSEIIPKAVGKATRGGLKVGKVAGNIGFKAGMGVLNKGLGVANFIKDNHDEIYDTAKAMGKGIIKEANEWGQAGIGIAGKLERTFLTDAPLDRSIFGKKFNKKGIALIAVGSTLMQQYIDDRQGTNDGRLYRPTTQMSTPYQLSEQMAYSSHGRSFADNAGATGDLVFALNNMRHG